MATLPLAVSLSGYALAVWQEMLAENQREIKRWMPRKRCTICCELVEDNFGDSQLVCCGTRVCDHCRTRWKEENKFVLFVPCIAGPDTCRHKWTNYQAFERLQVIRQLQTCNECRGYFHTSTGMTWTLECKCPYHTCIVCRDKVGYMNGLFHWCSDPDDLLKLRALYRIQADTCPKCFAVYEKAGGCKNMTCEACGARFKTRLPI